MDLTGIIKIIMAGGQYAGPLALVAFGGYLGPTVGTWPPSFVDRVAWICYLSMGIGMVLTAIQIILNIGINFYTNVKKIDAEKIEPTTLIPVEPDS